MKPIEFPEVTHRIAEHQSEYETLPASVQANQPHMVVCCIELTDEELEVLNKTKVIWHSQLSFGQPLQPMLMSVHKSDFFKTK